MTLPESHLGAAQTEISKPELLLVSANTALSLKEQIKRIQDVVLSGSAPNIYDVAYTLNVRREKLPHRAFTVVQDGGILETSSLAKAPAQRQDVYFIFSGQGAQWAGMYSTKIVMDRLQSLLPLVCNRETVRADKQYFSTGMGREFATSDPSFRRDIERMDEVLRRLKNPPEWNIMGKKDTI